MEEKKEVKTYDWKKGVKKVDKKEPVEEPKPEKVALKKPKTIEKPKEEAQPGIQLKPTPAKEPKEPEQKDEIKLKPVPAKPKPEQVGQHITNTHTYNLACFRYCIRYRFKAWRQNSVNRKIIE